MPQNIRTITIEELANNFAAATTLEELVERYTMARSHPGYSHDTLMEHFHNRFLDEASNWPFHKYNPFDIAPREYVPMLTLIWLLEVHSLDTVMGAIQSAMPLSEEDMAAFEAETIRNLRVIDDVLYLFPTLRSTVIICPVHPSLHRGFYQQSLLFQDSNILYVSVDAAPKARAESLLSELALVITEKLWPAVNVLPVFTKMLRENPCIVDVCARGTELRKFQDAFAYWGMWRLEQSEGRRGFDPVAQMLESFFGMVLSPGYRAA